MKLGFGIPPCPWPIEKYELTSAVTRKGKIVTEDWIYIYHGWWSRHRRKVLLPRTLPKRPLSAGGIFTKCIRQVRRWLVSDRPNLLCRSNRDKRATRRDCTQAEAITRGSATVGERCIYGFFGEEE